MRDNQTAHDARVRSDAIATRAALDCLNAHRREKGKHDYNRWHKEQRKLDREDREDARWN